MLLVLLWWSLHQRNFLFFYAPLLGFILRHLWAHFFISWEPFNICTYVFGVTVTVTTLNFFSHHLPLSWWPFFGYFLAILKDMFLHYLRTNHYFLIKVYRMFFVLIWQLLHYKVLGVLVGMLSPFRVLFRAVKNSQYFLMLFCIKLLGNTLMVTKKKNSWDSKCLVIFGPF